jgi:hypothetical protein
MRPPYLITLLLYLINLFLSNIKTTYAPDKKIRIFRLNIRRTLGPSPFPSKTSIVRNSPKQALLTVFEIPFTPNIVFHIIVWKIQTIPIPALGFCYNQRGFGLFRPNGQAQAEQQKFQYLSHNAPLFKKVKFLTQQGKTNDFIIMFT